MRVTLDRNIRGAEATTLFMPATLRNSVSLGDDRILEVKFATEMPLRLGTVLNDLELLSGSFSKYRQAIVLL
jgi:hypothetical protein